MRCVFIINPVAGKGKGVQTVTPMIEQYFSRNAAPYEVYITSGPREAQIFAQTEAAKGDEVVIFACGGEGTCFEVLNGMVSYPNAIFGVIPCGSANDFLKLFESTAPFCDIESQLNGIPTPIDLVKCDDEYCINGCSIGMDAMVANDMGIFKNWKFVSGSMAYKLAIVKNFFFVKIGVPLKVTIDGSNVHSGEFLFAVCANGCAYGGGYMPAPNANPEDGKLDYALVKKLSRLKIPGFLKHYEKGEFGHLECAAAGNCTVMEVTAQKPTPVNRDGEIIMKTSVRFELARRAVRFLVPAGAVKKY